MQSEKLRQMRELINLALTTAVDMTKTDESMVSTWQEHDQKYNQWEDLYPYAVSTPAVSALEWSAPMDCCYLSEPFYEMREHQIQMHGRTVTDMDKRVSKVILDAALTAIDNVQKGVRSPRVQAVPLSTGLGKSSSAYALIAAFARNNTAFSAAYVVPTIKMGIAAQEGIEALTGEGTTALWTSLHKHAGGDRRKALEELGYVPTRLVDKASLGSQRIIIVTHATLKQALFSGKDDGVLHFLGQRRSIVFIDEHPNFVRPAQVTTEEVQALHAQILRTDPAHHWLPVIAKIVHEMSSLAQGNGQTYVPVALSAPNEAMVFDNDAEVSLWDMTDKKASIEVRHREKDKLQRVLDYLRAASQGRAFYSRRDCQFFSYSTCLETDYPGFVLLDATSELAGLVTLNSHVTSVTVPPVNHERLQIHSIDMPKEFNPVQDVLKVASTSREYGRFIRESVLANTKADDDVLVVVHKDVLSMEILDVLSDDPEQPSDWEGRRVNALHWGTGVGSNSFREKTHVFMFGSFYPPRSATITQTHGWSQEAPTCEKLALAGGVRSTANSYAPRGMYKQVHEGSILSWAKQLAMRGNARNVDGEGKCLPMKLFLTMDLGLLLPNIGRMFPRAPMPVLAEPPACSAAEQLRGRLGIVRIVMSSKRAFISAEEIYADTGIETRNLSQECEKLKDVLHAYGWSVKSAKEIGLAGRMKYLVHDSRFMEEVLLAA